MGDGGERMSIRMVAGEDFVTSGLAQKLLDMGEPMPNLLLCVGWIVEEDGEIKACGVIQSLPFPELHAQPGYGKYIPEIYEAMKKFILESGAPRAIMHTSDARMKETLIADGALTCVDEFFDWRKG